MSLGAPAARAFAPREQAGKMTACTVAVIAVTP